ncbi:acyl-CoA N-acyltransferase, partial [Melampsora americana]
MSMSTTSTTTIQTTNQSQGSTSKSVLVDLTANNVGTVRKINTVLFPVRYSDKFYLQILEDSVSDFCKLIFFNDLPVGAVCCSVEPLNSPDASSAKPSEGKLYIMTLGVLAPYRRRGLATKLLDHVIQAAVKIRLPKLTSVYVHVQVGNEDAKTFYEGHGFVVEGEVKDYYRKIEPRDAWILVKQIKK